MPRFVQKLTPSLVAALLIFLTVCSGETRCQSVENAVNIGLPRFASYSGTEFDSVQVNNGNLHISMIVSTEI